MKPGASVGNTMDLSIRDLTNVPKNDVILFNGGSNDVINPLNAELNPICHLLALLGAHHILHVSRIRVKVNMNAVLSQITKFIQG